MNNYLILSLLLFILYVLPGAEQNNFNFSFDKDINIYNFNFNGDLYYNTNFGIFKLEQNYEGTSYQTNPNFREEQNILFEYDLPLYKNISLTTENKWYLFFNPNSTDKNKLQKINSAFGLRYMKNKKFMLGALAGREQNKQSSIEKPGNVFKVNGYIQNLNIDDYLINSKLRSEFVKLDDNRINNVFDFSATLAKSFNQTDFLTLNGNYNYHDNDILNSIGFDTERALYDNFAVENIFDRNYNMIFNFGFEVFENFRTNMMFNYNDVVIRRNYNNSFQNITNSLYGKQRTINNLNLKIDAVYEEEKFYQKFSAEFSENDETYDLSKKETINESEFETLLRREKQKDLLSSITRLYSETMYDLSSNNRFGLRYLASIKRDNTPSSLNNDDKDYSSWTVDLFYEHKFSSILKAGVNFKIDNNHLVYIKSERSSSNYQNKIYTLEPKVEIITKSFSMRPVIQLNANYMVYDYEELSSGVRSFSFRQISYKDSINLKINEKFSVFSRIILKYYERGKLLWNEFTELPELGSLENFDKLLLFFNGRIGKSAKYRIGSGFRYYTLQQEGLLKSNKGNKFNRISYGPETEINFIFSSGTVISISGWYEYQFLDGEYLKSVPNLYLETKIDL